MPNDKTADTIVNQNVNLGPEPKPSRLEIAAGVLAGLASSPDRIYHNPGTAAHFALSLADELIKQERETR